MRTYSMAALAFVLVMAGCSDKPADDKPVVAGSAVPNGAPVRLERNLPAAFTGLPTETGGRCAVDIVNQPSTAEAVTVKRSEGLSIYGWALDEKNGVVPPVAFLQLAGAANSYYAPLTRRSDRDDLSKAFGKPDFKNAGVGVILDIAALPSGKYEVLFLQKGDKTSIGCATKVSVTLVD